ncbi:MAG: hypothetical protein ACK4WJ_02455 [Endomicrobiia bacterium]
MKKTTKDPVKVYNVCKDSPATNIFFVIGLIATISIRAIGIAGLFNDIMTKILWYIGVVGFFLYFVYKYNIEKTRRNIIVENKIIDKIVENPSIDEKDKIVLTSIMCGLVSKKDAINYFVIFFTSAISLFIALIFDLKIIKGG